MNVTETIRRRRAYSVQRTGKHCLRRGFTLPEMLVTIGVVAIVAAVALPAFYSIRESFNSNGADTLISAALATAKAMAAKEQKYVGVRFQCLPDPEDTTKPGDQYIVFIIHDPALSASGFRAAKGIEPLKLPTNQAVMDLQVKANYSIATTVDKEIAADADIDDLVELWDATSFSIVFSPSGRLVTHDVRVWNMNGTTANTSEDMVFNTKTNVDGAIAGTIPTATDTYKGMFYQDDDTPLPRPVPGLGQESSRKSFVIYDRRDFRKYAAGSPWSSYLQRLSGEERLYINPYTGTIIENQSRRNAMK